MVYLDSLRNNIRKRTETDYIMPIWLPFIPVILGVAMSLIAIVGILTRRPFIPMLAMSSLVLVGLVAVIINIYVLYKWIGRRNAHFKRQLMMYRDLVTLLREISRERGVDISTQIALISREISEAEIEETEKSTVLWIILTLIIGIIIFYIYHFLTKDFFTHEKREDRIVRGIQEALEVLGVKFDYRRYYEIPHRNTILYILLTVITLGIFGFYWVYVITKDPNEHFTEQRKWEDSLVRVLEQLVLPPPPPS